MEAKTSGKTSGKTANDKENCPPLNHPSSDDGSSDDGSSDEKDFVVHGEGVFGDGTPLGGVVVRCLNLEGGVVELRCDSRNVPAFWLEITADRESLVVQRVVGRVGTASFKQATAKTAEDKLLITCLANPQYKLRLHFA